MKLPLVIEKTYKEPYIKVIDFCNKIYMSDNNYFISNGFIRLFAKDSDLKNVVVTYECKKRPKKIKGIYNFGKIYNIEYI